MWRSFSALNPPLTWDMWVNTTFKQAKNCQIQTLEVDTEYKHLNNKLYLPGKSTNCFCKLIQNPKATDKHTSFSQIKVLKKYF